MQRLAALAVLLALAHGLLACSEEASTGDGEVEPKDNGVAEMSGEQALDAADQAMSALEDATYRGFNTTDAPIGRVETTFVMVTGACQVTSRSPRLGVFEQRFLNGQIYMRADTKAARVIWGATGQQMERVADRWFESQGEEDSGSCALEDWIPGEPYRSRFEPGETTTVDGQEVIAFQGRSAEGPMTLWIATSGDPNVLRASGDDGDGPWELASGQFNLGIKLEAPSEATRLG